MKNNKLFIAFMVGIIVMMILTILFNYKPGWGDVVWFSIITVVNGRDKISKGITFVLGISFVFYLFLKMFNDGINWFYPILMVWIIWGLLIQTFKGVYKPIFVNVNDVLTFPPVELITQHEQYIRVEYHGQPSTFFKIISDREITYNNVVDYFIRYFYWDKNEDVLMFIDEPENIDNIVILKNI